MVLLFFVLQAARHGKGNFLLMTFKEVFDNISAGNLSTERNVLGIAATKSEAAAQQGMPCSFQPSSAAQLSLIHI